MAIHPVVEKLQTRLRALNHPKATSKYLIYINKFDYRLEAKKS